MIGIVVTGHGHFATGISSSVKLMAGKPEKFIAVDFEQEDSSDDLESKLHTAFKELRECEDGILVFTDLVGGQPYRQSTELAKKLKDEFNIVVLSGTNLGMLIECNLSRGFMSDISALADMAVETGKGQVMRFVPEEE